MGQAGWAVANRSTESKGNDMHSIQRDLIFALEEDLGSPALFTGRRAELEYFLSWVELTKKELSMSHAIMARKRRGKTALVQRLYNILYTRNDPKIIPFYIRIHDYPVTYLQLADRFYRQFVAQYLGFKLRRPDLINRKLRYQDLQALAADDEILSQDLVAMVEMVESEDMENAWDHAREAGHRISALKDERIIQFIDEFQFLNEYVFVDGAFKTRIPLGGGYQATGASKISPQIITGSYIGWLTMIIRHMVDRFDEYILGPFEPDEALASVYNYSSFYKLPVTDESASYITELCLDDPFYISALFESRYSKRDLRSLASIRETMKFEISDRAGRIGRMWEEYTWAAFDKLNDRNAKRVVLYLARYGDTSRSRKEILEDLELDMSDRALEELLFKLYRVDMVARTSSNYDYKGLGDPIFDMVFRRMYQREIEAVELKDIERDIERQLKQSRGRVAYYKGMVAEYRLVNRLLFAALQGRALDRIVRNCPPEVRFGPFSMLRKKVFHLDQTHAVEVDIFGQATDSADSDLVIEVKDWEQPVSQAALESFVQVREQVQPLLARLPDRPAPGFLFYAEHGLSAVQESFLGEHGIMCSDGASLVKMES